MRKKLGAWTIPVVLIMLVAVFLLRHADRPEYSASVADVPPFSGEPYVVINNNQPEFTQDDMTAEAYEHYSDLDGLGRCRFAMACVGTELMPNEERQSISQVKPTGWIQAQYDNVDGENLYNRCHLIGFQLTGENANEKNLITGTRYMNVEGMLPFENMIADYVKETGNHVLYRVTPVFNGENLLANGVQLEAKSVEDNGDGICFHVYVYNNQPGVTIDYADGSSKLSAGNSEETSKENPGEGIYILNTNSKKFHYATCAQAEAISAENKREFTGRRDALIEDGYVPAGCCKP